MNLIPTKISAVFGDPERPNMQTTIYRVDVHGVDTFPARMGVTITNRFVVRHASGSNTFHTTFEDAVMAVMSSLGHPLASPVTYCPHGIDTHSPCELCYEASKLDIADAMHNVRTEVNDTIGDTPDWTN